MNLISCNNIIFNKVSSLLKKLGSSQWKIKIKKNPVLYLTSKSYYCKKNLGQNSHYFANCTIIF